MVNKTVKWAIVGLGDIVRKRVGPAIRLQRQSQLRACVTRDPAQRRDDLASLEPDRVYTDMDAMLRDDDVDAVYIATPVFLHAPQTIAALRAGKHVIVEKPMALNSTEGEQMLRASEETGRQLAVAYYRRFWPTFEHVRKLLHDSSLGQLVLVRMALCSWYLPAKSAASTWRVLPEQSGGGVLYDVGSHRLDLLAWWFGLPSRLVADVATRTHPYPVDDSASALMRFGDGTPCTVSFQWNSKTWKDELQIVGTEASISFDVLDGEEMQLSRGREANTSTHARHANAHFPMIDDFAEALCEGRAPRFTASDGLSATRMMDWMTESASAGNWVTNGRQ